MQQKESSMAQQQMTCRPLQLHRSLMPLRHATPDNSGDAQTIEERRVGAGFCDRDTRQVMAVHHLQRPRRFRRRLRRCLHLHRIRWNLRRFDRLSALLTAGIA
jgi:hypothetical protein